MNAHFAPHLILILLFAADFLSGYALGGILSSLTKILKDMANRNESSKSAAKNSESDWKRLAFICHLMDILREYSHIQDSSEAQEISLALFTLDCVCSKGALRKYCFLNWIYYYKV